MGPDAAWIEIGSLFYRACDFSLDSGFSGFQAQLSRFSLHYHVFFSCINMFRVHFTECMY